MCQAAAAALILDILSQCPTQLSTESYVLLRMSIHTRLKLLSSMGSVEAAPSSSLGGAPAACAWPPALRSKKRATSSTITPARAIAHDPLTPMKAFHPVYWYLIL